LKIGVISDTHDYFDPRIPALFDGVEHILHAGDIGSPRIILELERIAPVTAVLGNNDDGDDYRDTEVIELANRKFLVHHIVNPRGLHEAIRDRVAHERPAVIVFGHTHKPFAETIGPTFFFNPGYAGRPRFNLDRSVAILRCEEDRITQEFLPLPR